MPLTESYDDHLPPEGRAAAARDTGEVGGPAGSDDAAPTADVGVDTATDAADDGGAPEPEPVLPEPVRQRIVTLTAAV
ncbi:hypothetical protein ACFQZ8_26900, partial [Micromonospora azadirachtae]